MFEVLVWLLEALWVWGIVLGVLIAFLVSYAISLLLWGELHVGLLGALCFVFAIVGLYIQLQVDLKQVRERRKRNNNDENDDS